MTPFTPWSALAGGLLIGLAATLLLLFNGRIAGVSGIAAGLVDRASGDERFWRAAFLTGLVVGTAASVAFGVAAPVARVGFGPGLLVAAGLMVGYGTALAGGCTSGHGVCGLARLSPRSFVAVAVFMAVALITVYVRRRVLVLP